MATSEHVENYDLPVQPQWWEWALKVSCQCY